MGAKCFHYDPAHYMFITLRLPLTAQEIEEPSGKPYLGFRLVLDPSVVTSVMVESGAMQPRGDALARGWYVPAGLRAIGHCEMPPSPPR